MEKSICLNSTGLVWNEERLAGRYDFFRRRREEVRLDLLYYPYWLIHLAGSAKWRFFGEKPMEMLLVSDGRTGRCRRVSSLPQPAEERLVFSGETDGFSPACFEAEAESGTALAHVAQPLLEQSAAEAEAEAFALAVWNRRCNIPLGPRADIRCGHREASLFYKPFWIMQPKVRPESGVEKMFIFDASTGLGGVTEYWSVVEYVKALQQKAEASL